MEAAKTNNQFVVFPSVEAGDYTLRVECAKGVSESLKPWIKLPQDSLVNAHEPYTVLYKNITDFTDKINSLKHELDGKQGLVDENVLDEEFRCVMCARGSCQRANSTCPCGENNWVRKICGESVARVSCILCLCCASFMF